MITPVLMIDNRYYTTNKYIIKIEEKFYTTPHEDQVKASVRIAQINWGY